MKYVIWGGNGFVGRYLADKLFSMNNNVVICDIQEVLDCRVDSKCEYLQIDVRCPESFEKLALDKDDIIINLAANQYHIKVPKDRQAFFYDTNTVGTENILKYAYAKGCMRYIMFTTDMTYGKPQYLPVDTSHPQNPFGPYGQSKKKCEDICREFRQKGMNITVFRPRMINGPGRTGILVKLFKLIDMNLPVPTIGNGKNHYQMVSVFDCVDAIICAINKGIPNKEYNLGSIDSPDIRTLLKAVIKMAGKHSIVIPTPGKLIKLILGVMDKIGLTLMYPEQFMIADEEYVLDISETMKDLDWHPKYNDRDMLIEAYKLYERSKTNE